MKYSRQIGRLLSAPRCLLLAGALLLAVSCASRMGVGKQDTPDAAFAQVKPVLERNCVHCHSTIRLPGMPSLTDTKSLADLIGPGKLIVPGKPEHSRFYLVTTFADDQAGAMPPSGHAISPREVLVLRDWIDGGAMLPSEVVPLQGVGRSPRSR